MKRIEDFRTPRGVSGRNADSALPATDRFRIPFKTMLRAAFILLAGHVLIQTLPLLSLGPPRQERAVAMDREAEAADRMRRAMKMIADEREARGYPIDPTADPNRSGLIGLPWSDLTTTLGSLAAKRSAAQPAAAVLLRRMLLEAGVGPGDCVAADSSGSFPGFAVATVIACESIGADCLLIASIGSSTWGANLPGFTLPDMIELLRSGGIIARGLVGASPGGANDTGSDMDRPSLEGALARAGQNGAILIREPEIERNIEARLAVIDLYSSGRPVTAFVSIGGNFPSTGGWESGNGILSRNSIILPEDQTSGSQKRGMVQYFLTKGIPVIRLLDIKDLAARTGLPWDPLPWPADPGMPAVPDPREDAIRRMIAALSLALALLSLAAGRKSLH